MSNRITAKGYLRAAGVDPESWTQDQLFKLGRDAARIGAGRRMPAVKIREEGWTVSTWPPEVWEEAAEIGRRGETAPPRPASQRQVAWLTCLAIRQLGQEAGERWVMDAFGGPDRDEDWVGEKIKLAQR